MGRLSSPQTYKVVEYLLAHPSTSQAEISVKTGASRNLVNHVVKQLELPGLVEQKGRLNLRLVDPLRLLEDMSIQRPLSSLLVESVRTEESQVSEAEKMVRSAAAHTGAYALTTFAALSKYTEYYIGYPTIHVYCERPAQVVNKLTPGRGDVAVQVLRPDFGIILGNTRRLKGFSVVEPVQVAVDLFGLGGPGRDGAMKLYKEITKL